MEKHATTSHTNTVMKNAKGMKVGDLVTWYGPDGQDIGLVTEYCDSFGWFIVWNSGEGNGWFSDNHDNIGVIR